MDLTLITAIAASAIVPAIIKLIKDLVSYIQRSRSANIKIQLDGPDGKRLVYLDAHDLESVQKFIDVLSKSMGEAPSSEKENLKKRQGTPE